MADPDLQRCFIAQVAVLLFLPCLVLANPEADAEAVPEPEPEPEPQSPNMLYGPGPVPTSQGKTSNLSSWCRPPR